MWLECLKVPLDWRDQSPPRLTRQILCDYDWRDKYYVTRVPCPTRLEYMALYSCRYKGIRLIKTWRRPSSLKQGKETCTFLMNLHGVGRSARPTSRWAPMVHHAFSWPRARHRKDTANDDLVQTCLYWQTLATRQLSLAVRTSWNGRQQKCRYRTSSELEDSVLEINHVTNVTTVLSETTASDRVSRCIGPIVW